MIDDLQDIRLVVMKACTSIDRLQEPMQELIQIRDFLRVLSHENKLNGAEENAEFAKLYYGQMVPQVVKRMVSERSHDIKYLEVCSEILEAFLVLFLEELKLKNLNQSFCTAMKMIFNHNTNLHRFHFQIQDTQLRKLRTQHQQWRADLKAGDRVDVLVKADEKGLLVGWMQGLIESVNNDNLYVIFPESSDYYDSFIDRWALQIAPFESHTKEDYEWRRTQVKNMTEVDLHDKSTWSKGTLFEIKKQVIAEDREIDVCHSAFRVYRGEDWTFTNKVKSDERGMFDGWSEKFDEWIPLFCPRIAMYNTFTSKNKAEDIELGEEMDDYYPAEAGFDRVYAVPRPMKCLSAQYVHFINMFGNQGGFEMLLDIIENEEISDQPDKMSITTFGALASCLNGPYAVYHKDFVAEIGERVAKIVKERLLQAPDKAIRNVRKEEIDIMIKGIDNIQKRFMDKKEREKDTEIMKLSLSIKCLNSTYLERRIQGIRELNVIIKNVISYTSVGSVFTGQFLLDWMNKNGVFSMIWDPKKTHLQIVQRTNEVFKLLLRENMLSEELLNMFWSLSKSDYRSEIVKIINDTSIYLKQPHIEFIFSQIKEIPSNELKVSEFECLCELGRYCKDEEFKNKVCNFFWDIISNSTGYNAEIVENCLNKFCEMVKYWEVKQKAMFFNKINDAMLKFDSPVIPILKLFKKLVEDQKEKTRYSMNTGTKFTSTGRAVANFSTSQVNDEQSQNTMEKELTLDDALNSLQQDETKGLVQSLLANLSDYFERFNQQFKKEEHSDVDSKQLFVVNEDKLNSHYSQLSERLEFLKFYAENSDYQNSKVQLKVIYDLFSKSPLPSDFLLLLTWCKNSCEGQSITRKILDLNEVGEFFSELMSNGKLDVANLPMIGFEFLQHYFLSVNENASKLIKLPPIVREKKEKDTGFSWRFYNPKIGQKEEEEEEDETDPRFHVLITPQHLEQHEMIWKIALECQNQAVVPKAVDFLIKSYMSLDEDLDDQRVEIQQHLIQKVIDLIKVTKEEKLLVRQILMLQYILAESEKKGTGDVQPHNAMLRGECYERVIIKNKTNTKCGNLVLRVYSSTTVWEFRREISKMLGLSVRYVSLKLPNGKKINNSENGKVLMDLGIKSGDIITARKIKIQEEIPVLPLLDENNQFVPRIKEIFNEWFTMYSDENDFMTPVTACHFLKGATNENVDPADSRIKGLFAAYDSNKDEKIERHEFLKFYHDACVEGRIDRVRENLKQHFIRTDLKKMSDIVEDASFTKEEMPRFTISKNLSQFNALMDLLERNDEASQQAWDLINSLCTNEDLYKEVLKLESIKRADGTLDWNQFFNSGHKFKQIYTLEIIEAVMEEGESLGGKRIELIERQQVIIAAHATEQQAKKVKKQEQLDEAESAPQAETAEEEKVQEADAQPVENSQEESEETLKANWTKMFLENNGFVYILDSFMNKQFDFSQQFEQKHLTFILKLIRIFMLAALSIGDQAEVYQAVKLSRRSSSMREENDESTADPSTTAAKDPADQTNENDEGQRFKQLQQLLDGPLGLEIIDAIDHVKIQEKSLSVISQIIQKDSFTLEEKLIVENALNLWIGCLLHKQDTFEQFVQFPAIEGSKITSCKDFIMTGTLYCSDQKIREEFRQSLSALCKKWNVNDTDNNPLNVVMQVLSENFSQISDYSCNQFFELFNEITDSYFLKLSLAPTQTIKCEFDAELILSQIIDKIRAEKNVNDSNNNGEEIDEIVAIEQQKERQRLLIGLIQLTGKIIVKVDSALSEKIVEEKDLVNEIFKEFLFTKAFEKEENKDVEYIQVISKNKSGSSNSNDQSNSSREAAYKLLINLVQSSPALMRKFIENQLGPLLDIVQKPNEWNYTPPSTSFMKQSYVGLVNLGCICYMNSMMQQFFMIPAFRYNLLCVDDGVAPEIVQTRKNAIDDNMLHQMQRLFANLELSDRMDYDPYDFCFSFKEFEGGPTNVMEQKDAQEFLNVLFDRLDNALKPTPCKYLLSSIFGGKTCSQMVCTECGKLKNRSEDYLTLSLTVKDIKSVYDSLEAQAQGEVINDYQCDGCNKKVDIKKRTLITETPNVLIVHCQRLVFNFETFQNDKINSLFDFPTVLDLKPYSYYDVMEKENRIPKEQAEDEDLDQEEPQQNEEQPEEESQKGKGDEKKEEEEKLYVPIQDDCFEYKLVGVNVHSGSANSGHYWSYINTNRGCDELDGKDPNWERTENDPWMEFNDSIVKDFDFSKLKDECFGSDEKSTGGSSAWNFSGGDYGQSGYMLFYERREKKPIKVLVPEEEVEQAKEQGIDIQHDEEKKEYFKNMDYRDPVKEQAPNSIYQKVLVENKKCSYENDCYSTEFFDFIKQILVAVASFAKGEETSKLNKSAMLTTKKFLFNILSRCFYNQSMKDIVDIMIAVFESDDQLCVDFMTAVFEDYKAEDLFEILFECQDATARSACGNIFKYLMAKLKVIEKDILFEQEEYEVQTYDNDGNVSGTRKELRPKAICARFFNYSLTLLKNRAARSWSKFSDYLEIILAFGIGDVEGCKRNTSMLPNFDLQTLEARLGLEYCFRMGLVEKLADFIMGDNSPLAKDEQYRRVQMGSTYMPPNLTSIFKLLTAMTSDDELLAKYPLTEIEQEMLASSELLQQMLEVNNKAFAGQITKLCSNNYKTSKKVAKVFISAINQANSDKVSLYLKALKKFLLIDDDLKQQKLEWIFGFSQVISNKPYRQEYHDYGLEATRTINEETATYTTTLGNINGCSRAIFDQLLRCRGSMDTFCIKSLKDLLSLADKDDMIAKYIWDAQPPTYMYSRYSDWFREYINSQKMLLQQTANANNYQYFQGRIKACEKAVALLAKYEEKAAKFAAEEKAQFEARDKEQTFQGLDEQWLGFKHDEVIPHYPVTYVIGKQVSDDKDFLVYDENESVKVYLKAIKCEYMFSNPTGLFNLSLPNREMKTKTWQLVSYAQHKKAQQENQEEELVLDVRDWDQMKQEDEILLKVEAENKTQTIVKVQIRIIAENESDCNVTLPKSTLNTQLLRGDSKVLIHLQKIDPTRPFGNMKIEIVKVKERKSTGNAQHIVTQMSGYDQFNITPSYGGGVDRQDSDDYAHNIYGGQAQVQCNKCREFNEATELNCKSCGEYLTQYDYDDDGNVM